MRMRLRMKETIRYIMMGCGFLLFAIGMGIFSTPSTGILYILIGIFIAMSSTFLIGWVISSYN